MLPPEPKRQYLQIINYTRLRTLDSRNKTASQATHRLCTTAIHKTKASKHSLNAFQSAEDLSSVPFHSQTATPLFRAPGTRLRHVLPTRPAAAVPLRRRRGGRRNTQGNRPPTPVTHRRYHHDNRRTHPLHRLVSRPRSMHVRGGGRPWGHDACLLGIAVALVHLLPDRQAGISHSFLVISHSSCNLLPSIRLISGQVERGMGETRERETAPISWPL